MMEEEGMLRAQETKIMKAALKLDQNTVQDVMTPLDKVYMLEIN